MLPRLIFVLQVCSGNHFIELPLKRAGGIFAGYDIMKGRKTKLKKRENGRLAVWVIVYCNESSNTLTYLTTKGSSCQFGSGNLLWEYVMRSKWCNDVTDESINRWTAWLTSQLTLMKPLPSPLLDIVLPARITFSNFCEFGFVQSGGYYHNLKSWFGYHDNVFVPSSP